MFRNWKTTLAGVLGGIANIGAAALTGTLGTKDAVVSLVIIVISAFAKDFDVSGTK